MLHPLKFVVMVSMAASMLAAQEPGWARKFSISLGGGVAVPREDLRGIMSTSPLFRLGGGFRFHPNLQADFGLDVAFHAAGVDFRSPSIIGDIRVRDQEYMVPLGGRAILPLGRVELFGSGGAAYLNYREKVEVPGSDGDDNFDCTICQSRGGWGYYAGAGVNVALDRRQRFWVGGESRVIRGHTSGQTLGLVPPFETRDTWINTAAVFIIRFP